MSETLSKKECNDVVISKLENKSKESEYNTILDEAKKILYEDREKTYGNPGKNMKKTAELWSAYLGVDITYKDVALMMICLKVAREKNSPKRDNLVGGRGMRRWTARTFFLAAIWLSVTLWMTNNFDLAYGSMPNNFDLAYGSLFYIAIAIYLKIERLEEGE